MNILIMIFILFSALLAGYFIQLASNVEGVLQIIAYAFAVYNAAFCFTLVRKFWEDE